MSKKSKKKAARKIERKAFKWFSKLVFAFMDYLVEIEEAQIYSEMPPLAVLALDFIDGQFPEFDVDYRWGLAGNVVDGYLEIVRKFEEAHAE